MFLFQYGSLSGPFGPVLDGSDGLLPKTPAELRRENNVMKVNILAGVTKDEGSYIAGGYLWCHKCAGCICNCHKHVYEFK